MTVLQIIVAIGAFALAFYSINRWITPGIFKNILFGVVVVLALFVLLEQFGLMGLLNTPVTSGYHR